MLKKAAHPGEILKDELAEIGVSPEQFARETQLPAKQVNQIIGGECSITRGIAQRIGSRLAVDPEFWVNLQEHFDLVNIPQKGKQAVLAAQNTAD